MFRMVTKTTNRPGGVPTKKVSRQTHYLCKEDITTREIMRQTQLSFPDVKRTTIPAVEDTMGGEECEQPTWGQM